MFMSVETDTTDIREKIYVALFVDVFASTAHRQMKLY